MCLKSTYSFHPLVARTGSMDRFPLFLFNFPFLSWLSFAMRTSSVIWKSRVIDLNTQVCTGEFLYVAILKKVISFLIY